MRAKRIFFCMTMLFCSRLSGTEIDLMHWWASPAEQKLVSLMAKELKHQGVELSASGVAGVGFQSYFSQLTERLQQGRPPDFAQLSGHRVQPAHLRDIVYPDAAPGWDDWIPLAVQQTAKQGERWFAVPVSVHAINWLWVNASLWRQLESRPPDNWQELLVVLQKAQDKGWIPLAVSGSNWNISVLFSVVAIDVLGADHYRRILIERKLHEGDDRRLRRIFSRMNTLRSFAPDNYQSLTPQEAMALMQNGQALMHLQGTWANAALTGAGWQPGRDFECFHFPGTQAMPIFISDLMVSYQGSPASLQDKQRFINTIMGRDFQKRWSLLSGGLPARVDISLDGFNDCSRKVISNMRMSHMHGTVVSFRYEHREQIEQVIMHHFNQQLSDDDAAARLIEILSPPPVTDFPA